MKKRILFGLLLLLAVGACKNESSETQEKAPEQPAKAVVTHPPFNADSAYAWVEAQVNFGPRTPGSAAHAACADYLVKTLQRFTPEVQVQSAPIKAHDGKTFQLKNIIASFNPTQKKRVVLAAHWDTRPRADQDTERTNQAIDGANDGASGVAVLLEMARNFALQAPSVGVDIVLFDLEDYGISEVADSYCLGSQYWAANPHKTGYRAEYGILYDMVGGKDARFYMEGYSMYYAPHIMRKVWNAAHDLGFGSFFTFQQSNPITDDHYYVNKIAGIPMIDIIEHDPTSPTGFGKYWHTHDDGMEVIDRATLQAVGQSTLWVVYQE